MTQVAPVGIAGGGFFLGRDLGVDSSPKSYLISFGNSIRNANGKWEQKGANLRLTRMARTLDGLSSSWARLDSCNEAVSVKSRPEKTVLGLCHSGLPHFSFFEVWELWNDGTQ